MKRFLLASTALVFLGLPEHASAQGCGPSNPNCIVPTPPVGTSNNQAASTAFVQNSGNGPFVTPDKFCTVDRTGVTDMGACINSAISAAKNCGTAGNGVMRLSAGTYLVSTPIVPQACVSILGDGSGETVLLTNHATPFLQTSGAQLVHFRLRGITFKDSGTHASAIVMTFTSIMGSAIEDIEFGGYTTGTLMSIAGAANSTFSDSSGVWGGNSNSFFNFFGHWTAGDGCAKCVMMAGAYGGTPTASPVNSSNAPSIVVTQNDFYDMNFWGVSTIGWDFIKAVDTVNIRKAVILHSANNGISAQLGDDNANFPGNNYVNGIRMQISISANAGVTGTTFFRAGDWTFGNAIDLETDMSPANFSLTAAQANVTLFKLDMCGKNSVTGLLDGLGFNTNRLCFSGNFGSVNDGQGTFYRVNNGSATLPIFGFTNDSTNGFWLCAGSFTCFTKGVQVGTNGVAQGAIQLNGATTGGGTVSASATGGHLNLSSSSAPSLTAGCNGAGSSVSGTDSSGTVTGQTALATTCTLTFGQAFGAAPNCIAMGISSPLTGAATPAAGTLVVSFASAANYKFSYFCPGA